MSTPSLAEHIFLTGRRPMIVLDLDWRVRMANRAYYKAFQMVPEIVEGRPFLELDGGRWNTPKFRGYLENLRSTKSDLEGLPMEIEPYPSDPRTFTADGRYIATEESDASAILIVIEDVTNRRLAEQLTESHTAALEQSNTDLEQFAYVASHDLQEPLRMVASYTQLLAERYRGKLDADADDFIGFVVDGVHRMQGLITALLEYSRVDRRPDSLRDTNCNHVLAVVQLDLQQAIAESGAAITNDPLPVIFASPQMIGQLLQNLIGNALKVRKRGVASQVHISASRKDGDWLFSVQDNGIGIAPDQRGRLFQIFQRLHSRSEYPGTGIGLALCKKIVERHGGRLWLESEAGQGSTFFFTMPVKPGEN